jgi:hypothetical protein
MSAGLGMNAIDGLRFGASPSLEVRGTRATCVVLAVGTKQVPVNLRWIVRSPRYQGASGSSTCQRSTLAR